MKFKRNLENKLIEKVGLNDAAFNLAIFTWAGAIIIPFLTVGAFTAMPATLLILLIWIPYLMIVSSLIKLNRMHRKEKRREERIEKWNKKSLNYVLFRNTSATKPYSAGVVWDGCIAQLNLILDKYNDLDQEEFYEAIETTKRALDEAVERRRAYTAALNGWGKAISRAVEELVDETTQAQKLYELCVSVSVTNYIPREHKVIFTHEIERMSNKLSAALEINNMLTAGTK